MKKNNNRDQKTLQAFTTPQRQLVKNVRKMIEPSQQIANIIKRQQVSAKHLRELACPTRHVTEIMGQLRHQQQLSFDLMADYAFGLRDIVSKAIDPVIEGMQQFRQMYNNALGIFSSVMGEQQKIQKTIIEALQPSFQIQNSIALEMSKINIWHNAITSIADSLQSLDPAVEVMGDSLIIGEEQFSQERINQLAQEYIWDESSNRNISKQCDNSGFWKAIPKSVRWLILFILSIYLTAIWNKVTENKLFSPDNVAKQVIHLRKQEVRQINKGYLKHISPPFVNTEHLLVHVSSRKQSRVNAVLSYPCEVNILRYKNHKRWVLIEWDDGSGEKHQGWALTRYIYRKRIHK